MPSSFIECPICHGNLRNDNGYVSCVSCDKRFPKYDLKSNTIIDLLDLEENKCQCNRDGLTVCNVSLKKDLKPLKNKKIRKRKKESSIIGDLIAKELGKKKRIIDIGCAEGRYGPILSEHNEAYALDSCPQRQLIPKNKEGKLKENILDKGYTMIFLGDALKSPFKNNSFDIVILTEVIEHVTETRALIVEINRILKKNGILILSTPNLASLGNRLGLLFGKGIPFHPIGPLKGEGFFPSDEWRGQSIHAGAICYPDQPLHVRFFTLESLRNFLNQEGFEVLKEKGLDSRFPGFTPDFIKKILKTWTTDLFVIAKKRPAAKLTKFTGK